MTSPALISAQPWRDDDARRGLIDRAVAERGTLAGVGVRVIPEPLLRTENGVPVEAVRVIPDAGDPPVVDAVRAGDDDLLVATLPGPAGSTRLLVRRVDSPTRVALVAGADRVELELLPQRPWSVHLVHHSHFDFGYTDPQTEVFQAQRSYLDSVLELTAATDDWPDDARFRWNAEALWAFDDWAAHRSSARVEELLRRVREGRVDLSALPFNLHTDVCSTEELHELLAGARRLRDEHGIAFPTAMQTDVPGQVVGLPDALQEVGVRYLSVAHNWAGRSQPHTNGGFDLPRLFRWRTPAGGEVIVWMTDSPHGLAYMEGPMLGFHDGSEWVDEFFPPYLQAIATRGYPFPPGTFGAHGEDIEPDTAYPWDVLHLRTHGWIADNAPARARVSEIVRDWNETWESPRLRVSTNADFFAEAEQRYGDQLRTFTGDWGDWWVEGVGSAAQTMSVVRRAQDRVSDGRATSRLVSWAGGAPVRDEAPQADAAYDSITMFDEHTWGASNSWLHGDRGYDSGERQWQWKSAQAHIAGDRADGLVDAALAAVADAVPPSSDALASLVVVEQAGLRRTGVVRAFLKESLVAFDQPFAIVDPRSGETVPHVVAEQENRSHREAGRWVSFRVDDAPSFGLLRFDVVASSDDPGGDDPASDLEPLTIRNEHLTVRIDPAASTIASVVDNRTGRELVQPDAVVGFNGYVYDRYASAPRHNHLANKLATSDRLEMLATRQLARPSVVLEHTADAVEQRIVYESAAPGTDGITTTLRLRAGEPLLLIENRIRKPLTDEKESAYFAFPFAATDPTVRYEVSGGVAGDDLEHVPGAPRHMRAVRHWVTVEGAEGGAVWVTQDAPLVQPSTIAVPYAPFPASTAPEQPATVWSWVHNNLWDTNFPIEQGFEMTFTYAVGVPVPAESLPGAAVRTAAAVSRPLRAVGARGVPGGVADEVLGRSLLELDDDRVAVLSVVDGGSGSRVRSSGGVGSGGEGSSIVRLQSFADEPVELGIRFGVPIASAQRTTLLGDALGDLTVADGEVHLRLQPFEKTGLRLVLRGAGA